MLGRVATCVVYRTQKQKFDSKKEKVYCTKAMDGRTHSRDKNEGKHVRQEEGCTPRITLFDVAHTVRKLAGAGPQGTHATQEQSIAVYRTSGVSINHSSATTRVQIVKCIKKGRFAFSAWQVRPRSILLLAE